MDDSSERATTTGSGFITPPTPKKADASNDTAPTGARSKPSLPPASIASRNTSNDTGSTKPRNLAEALALIQTDLADFVSLGGVFACVDRAGILYLRLEVPGQPLGFEAKNILLNGERVRYQIPRKEQPREKDHSDTVNSRDTGGGTGLPEGDPDPS